MIDKRIAAGFALVAGLGLASVAAAPVSGAATPSAAHTAHAQPAGKGGGKGEAKGGKQVVCIIQAGKPGGKGGPVTLPPLPGKPGKGTGDRIEVKVVNGKVTVYVNGKPAPAGSVHVGTGAKCPAPPKGLPGSVTTQPGTGVLVLQEAPGADEAGLSTSGLHV